MTDLHEYTDQFFEYIERGSISSAKRIAKFTAPLLGVESLLDVGCGRGAWLNEWQSAGVKTTHGVDGPYVRRTSLLIPECDFFPMDLSKSFDLGRRYDLVTSLEVAEHLPPPVSGEFIASLTKHSDRVLFSAATRGQGGENHINEQPLSYWQRQFAIHDFVAFDIVRPQFRLDPAVEPWFKYNTVLYVRASTIQSLPQSVLDSKIQSEVREGGSFPWRLRRLILRTLPQGVVTKLAQLNSKRANFVYQLRSGRESASVN